MPNPREALTAAELPKKNVRWESTPAEEDALPQITALTQPYMFTIGAGAGQCGKPTRPKSQNPLFFFVNRMPAPTNGLRNQGEEDSGGKPSASTAVRTNSLMWAWQSASRTGKAAAPR